MRKRGNVLDNIFGDVDEDFSHEDEVYVPPTEKDVLFQQFDRYCSEEESRLQSLIDNTLNLEKNKRKRDEVMAKLAKMPPPSKLKRHQRNEHRELEEENRKLLDKISRCCNDLPNKQRELSAFKMHRATTRQLLEIAFSGREAFDKLPPAFASFVAQVITFHRRNGS